MLYNDDGDGDWAMDKFEMNAYASVGGVRAVIGPDRVARSLTEIESRHDLADISLVRNIDVKVLVQVLCRS